MFKCKCTEKENGEVVYFLQKTEHLAVNSLTNPIDMYTELLVWVL
jgi:hypothetical protein